MTELIALIVILLFLVPVYLILGEWLMAVLDKALRRRMGR